MKIKGFTSTTQGVSPLLDKEKSEKIIHIYKDTGLYEDNVKLNGEGSLFLTNLQLIWSDEASAICHYMKLDAIASCKFESGFLRSSPKIELNVKAAPESEANITQWMCEICNHLNFSAGKCVQCGVAGKVDLMICPSCTYSNIPGSISCEMCEGPLRKPFVKEEFVVIKIAFRGRSLVIQDVYNLIQRTLDSLASSPSERVITNSMGVSGIMKSLEDASKKRDVVVEASSFKDLESLMEKAQEMTRLAESLVQKLSKSELDGAESATALQQDLMDFGIMQPVTKESSGNQYFKDLAKELSDFLVRYSKKSCMTQYSLSDAFCLFNRARGISLVSPQDLFRASTQLKGLSLPFELKTFDSGVHVLVESNLLSTELLSRSILELLQLEQGLTASRIASKLNMSVIVAKEHMLLAEKNGTIVRDDTVHGLCFYPNIFL